MSNTHYLRESLTAEYGPLTEHQRFLADSFYSFAKDKPTRTLQRYERVLRPKGLLDALCDYMRNDDRKAKHAAVNRLLGERNLPARR